MSGSVDERECNPLLIYPSTHPPVHPPPPLLKWSEITAMTYNSSALVQINPDPRFLTIVVIGTAQNVDTYIRDQHLRGYAKMYGWSKPQPAPDGSDKVLVALNRIMV
jgi:hypothetical protein